MHLFREIVGTLAGGLAFVAFLPYLVSIMRGKTKPERATFGIWSLINLVTVSSYIASGARTTIWTGLVYTVLQFIVFGLAIKRGMGGFNRLDITCVLGAILGVVFWLLTDNPQTALYISLVVEVLGFIPLLKKVYMLPGSESTIAWVLSAAASILNMFALTDLHPQTLLYPLYNAVFDSVLAFLLLFPLVRFSKQNVRRNKKELA